MCVCERERERLCVREIKRDKVKEAKNSVFVLPVCASLHVEVKKPWFIVQTRLPEKYIYINNIFIIKRKIGNNVQCYVINSWIDNHCQVMLQANFT